MWSVPEEQVHILPDVRGSDVVDLGCGTGYWCAWFARLGASPIGLDVSEAQLETARSLQAEHGIEFPLLHASAEAPPFEDRSFDLVFSEYGAAIWCDPAIWIPQAFRILRPGGRLIFLGNSVLTMLTAPSDDTPCGDALLRPMFGMRRLEWDDTDASNFCLPHGEMLRLLRETGLRGRGPARAARPGRRRRRGALLRPPRMGAAVAVRGRVGRAAPPGVSAAGQVDDVRVAGCRKLVVGPRSTALDRRSEKWDETGRTRGVRSVCGLACDARDVRP